jgi:D-alanyl-D-alanine carboxypeptidase
MRWHATRMNLRARFGWVVVVASLIVASASPLAAETITEQWRPGMKAAIRYANQRQGSISFAVKAPSGKLFAYRGHRAVPAASTIKVMFMAAYLRHEARHRKLNAHDRSLLAPMIRRSDNSAASAIANRLGPRPINRLARAAKMHHFRYTRPWGLSRVDATEQARFMFHLGRFIPDRHEDYARYLLAHIVKSQRWGIAKLNRPRYKLYFKSGWGSGSGGVSHQVAWLERRFDVRISVAIMIENSPNHAYSTQTLRGIAARLLRDLP